MTDMDPWKNAPKGDRYVRYAGTAPVAYRTHDGEWESWYSTGDGRWWCGDTLLSFIKSAGYKLVEPDGWDGAPEGLRLLHNRLTIWRYVWDQDGYLHASRTSGIWSKGSSPMTLLGLARSGYDLPPPPPEPEPEPVELAITDKKYPYRHGHVVHIKGTPDQPVASTWMLRKTSWHQVHPISAHRPSQLLPELFPYDLISKILSAPIAEPEPKDSYS